MSRPFSLFLLLLLSACAAAGAPTSMPAPFEGGAAVADVPAAEAPAGGAVVAGDPVKTLRGSGYPAGSLGAALQTELRKLSFRCLTDAKDVSRYLTRGEERIIQDVVSAGLADAVFQVPGSDLGPIFRFVYTDRSLADYIANIGVPGRELAGSKVAATPLPEQDNLLYIHSCTSMMRAALEGEVNGSWPVVTLRSAIEAEYADDKTVHFTLVSGRFKSPLTTDLLQPATPGHLTAMLQVWQAHLARPDMASQPRYLLDNVNAWFVIELMGLSRRTRGRISSEQGGNWIVASVNTALTATADVEAQLNSSSFRLFARPDGVAPVRYGNFIPMPDVDAVEAALNNAVRHLPAETEANRFLAPGGTERHRQVALGIPEAQCTPGTWRMGPLDLLQPAPGTVRLNDVTYDGAGSGTCTFHITFAQTGTIDPAVMAAGELPLQYRFETVASLNLPQGRRPLVVRASAPVQLSTQPLIRSTGAPPLVTLARTGSEYHLHVELPFQVSDDLVPIRRDDLGSGGRADAFPVLLICGPWEHTGQSWVLPNGNAYTLAGEFRFPASTEPSKLPSTDACDLRASISLPRSGGGPYQRNWTASFRLSEIPKPDAPPAGAVAETSGR